VRVEYVDGSKYLDTVGKGLAGVVELRAIPESASVAGFPGFESPGVTRAELIARLSGDEEEALQIPITKIPAIEVLCRDGAGILISLENAVDLTASQGIARRLSVVAADLSQSPAAGKALDPEGVSGHYKNLGVGRGELHLERRVDGFAVVHLNGCVIQSHPLDEETATVDFVIDRKSVTAQCTS